MSHANHWMPLYVGDYLADTMHLSGAEHGAYLLLLMHSWRTGPLPDDDRQLARIAATDAKGWRRMSSTIRTFFTRIDGCLVQARLERVRAQQGKFVEQRRAAGRASAEARKSQRNGNGRSTVVEAPLPPRAGKPEPESKDKEPSLCSGQSASPPSLFAGPAFAPPDARTSLFREGLERTIRLTGKPPNAARALLGRFLKAAADDAALVSLVLLEAEEVRPADPLAWITATLQFRTGQRATAGRANPLDGWIAMTRNGSPDFNIDAASEEWEE